MWDSCPPSPHLTLAPFVISLSLFRFPSSLPTAFGIINDAIESRRGLGPAGAVPQCPGSRFMGDRKIEREKDTRRQIGRGRERGIKQSRQYREGDC